MSASCRICGNPTELYSNGTPVCLTCVSGNDRKRSPQPDPAPPPCAPGKSPSWTYENYRDEPADSR
jgi:hypothetical protein